MTATIRSLCVLLLLLAPTGSAVAQWTEFKSDDFGFRMLLPPGAKGLAKDFGKGWGGLVFTAGAHTEVFAIAKRGFDGRPDDLRAFAIEASQIPAAYWQEVEGGAARNQNGFKWFESWIAGAENGFVVALLGTGPKASYVIFLTTTKAEYQAGKAQFDKWFASIHAY